MDIVKLVIWDLDDTFWSGTLSEEEITPIQFNIDLVKELVERGIMNSISSKNNQYEAKKKLQELGVWDYFIFPRINWQPKGKSVNSIIELAQLRPQNVLFLDDNHLNLKEVKFYNDAVWVEDPNFIFKITDHDAFIGKEDKEHSRLHYYRILERKNQERTNYSDNKEFLQTSGIQLAFISEVLSGKGRIFELIQRTNQINYTKKRIAEHELDELLENTDYECKMIRVKDRFGEYGVVGFYALQLSTNRLEHFLFSCRAMNIGLEQFVYAHLSYPEIIRVGAVTAELTKEPKPNWITVSEDWNQIIDEDNETKPIRLLLKGACDLNQMLHYLNYKNLNLQSEFNFVNVNNHPVPQAHSFILLQSGIVSDTTKSYLIDKLPFWDESIFSTKVFEQEYDVLVYSLLLDYTMDLYNSKRTNVLVPYESYSDFINETKEQFVSRCKRHGFIGMDEEFYDDFKSDFTFQGQIIPEDLRNNLESLRSQISKPIIFINGAEIRSPKNNVSEFGKAQDRHRILNKVLDDFCAEHDNAFLLDVRKFVNDEGINHSIRHYKRHVYEEMAQELIRIVGEISKVEYKRDEFRFKLKKISKILYENAKDIFFKLKRVLLAK
ncbi:HAD-IIIC family phosphatase [Labilibaculum sp. DW002]|uniref:HAD-IIIC family phosphatase n=1 Tax=Paralabilibaculum antarcticum TaxID=2912572 RepID=A0ABT5VQA4_9BACT|nr:HAD-IIIC family phosphatase [Labilibaculum sp. DW002]MDE5417609.1 HAD-IIIC family phosphatase [Labilibaculum sp. DW002]